MQFKKKLEFLGHSFFYLTLFISGQTGAYLFLYPIIFVYVSFSRRIRLTTADYLKKRFPSHTPYELWLDTFKLVISFSRVLVDRAWLSINKNASLDYTFTGRDSLNHEVAKGKGLVLLIAHVGNWQIAMGQLPELNSRVHALMHQDAAEISNFYFDRQGKRNFTVINTEGFMGGMIEATTALQKGEIVTIMGDRYLKGPSSKAIFMNTPVNLPTSAYSLAAATGAPVAILLAAKKNKKEYQLKVWDIFSPEYTDRDSRQEIIDHYTKRFAKILEEYLDHFPYQWYNFYNFWKQ
jgi:predicted LPLAT superfamily acyltransferase